MTLREERIGALVQSIRQESHGFRRPPFIVIGGYALRAFVPFARYSRDCDFALPKAKTWVTDRIAAWFPDLTIEAKEQQDQHAYLRLIQLVPAGKHRIKISLDFMEGEILGRAGERLIIDKRFMNESTTATIHIATRPVRIRVPSYQDYLLLKLVSARPSDIRDIAALLWKKGIPTPNLLLARSHELFTTPPLLGAKLTTVITEVDHPRFLDSWRGTFLTNEFTEHDKTTVLKELRSLRDVVRVALQSS